MNKALDIWREKLAYLEQEEAIAVDPAQKFALAQQIKQAKAKMAELESAVHRNSEEAFRPRWVTRRKIVRTVVALLLLGAVGAVLLKYCNAPKDESIERKDEPNIAPTVQSFTAGAGFSIFAKPEQDSQIVSRVNAGEKCDLVIGKGTNNWAVVRYRNKEGWVMAQDMSAVTPIEVARGFGFRGSYWQLFFTSPEPGLGPANEFGVEVRFAHAISQCRSSVDLAAWAFSNNVVTEAILDAHTRGVKVRIVTDKHRITDSHSTVGKLTQSRIPVVAKALMGSKFAILDGTTVWTGSFNYTESTSENNESLIAIDLPEIAAAYLNYFEYLFKYTDRKNYIATAQSPKLSHGVHVFFSPGESTLEEFHAVFRNAKKSIRFMTFNFKDEELEEILREQALNGVSIRGIVESASVNVAQSLLFRTTPNLDMRVDGNKRFLRHNCAIIDDRLVFLCSMSFTNMHTTRFYDSFISVSDAALASKFIEEFERLWLISKNPKLEDLSKIDE